MTLIPSSLYVLQSQSDSTVGTALLPVQRVAIPHSLFLLIDYQDFISIGNSLLQNPSL